MSDAFTDKPMTFLGGPRDGEVALVPQGSSIVYNCDDELLRVYMRRDPDTMVWLGVIRKRDLVNMLIEEEWSDDGEGESGA
jgi:hypothetical protein